MADIELVIKIPEKTVNEIKDNAMLAGSISSDIRWDVTRAIENGILLPKCNGKLIYVDAVSEEIKKLKIIFGTDKAGKFFKWVKVKEVLRTIRDMPPAEAIPKVDVVDMLEKLYMKIEELDTPSDDSYDAGIVDCEKIIQEKINVLKVNKEQEE